jgi:hypothetical protein
MSPTFTGNGLVIGGKNPRIDPGKRIGKLAGAADKRYASNF